MLYNWLKPFDRSMGELMKGFELFKSATWPEHLATFVDCVTQCRRLRFARRSIRTALEAPQPAFVAYRAMGLTTKAIEGFVPCSCTSAPAMRVIFI